MRVQKVVSQRSTGSRTHCTHANAFTVTTRPPGFSDVALIQLLPHLNFRKPNSTMKRQIELLIKNYLFSIYAK